MRVSVQTQRHSERERSGGDHSVRVVNRNEAQMEAQREIVRERNRHAFDSLPWRGRVYDRRALGLYVDLLIIEGCTDAEAWNVVASRYDEAHASWCAGVCGER